MRPDSLISGYQHNPTRARDQTAHLQFDSDHDNMIALSDPLDPAVPPGSADQQASPDHHHDQLIESHSLRDDHHHDQLLESHSLRDDQLSANEHSNLSSNESSNSGSFRSHNATVANSAASPAPALPLVFTPDWAVTPVTFMLTPAYYKDFHSRLPDLRLDRQGSVATKKIPTAANQLLRRCIGKLNCYFEKSTRPDISYAVHQCARFYEACFKRLAYTAKTAKGGKPKSDDDAPALADKEVDSE
jgi:hypothetical protein